MIDSFKKAKKDALRRDLFTVLEGGKG